MTDLASKVLVSPQAISAYEKGDKTPHPSVLEAIASALELPSEFFFSPLRFENVGENGTFFFRSLSAATIRARKAAQVKGSWMREVYTYLASFVKFPPLYIPAHDLPRDPLVISSEDIEDAATHCRKEWGLGLGPISNLSLLLENKGFVLAQAFLNSPKLDAVSLVTNRAIYVLLGLEKSSRSRSRFDLAHELGHAVLHQGVLQRSFQKSEHFRLIENQAHRFAAAFLFPQEAFLSEIFLPSIDLFLSMKARWKVSVKMMLVRAYKLHMISEREYRNLLVSYNRRGWHRGEPNEENIPHGRPRLLRRSIEMLTARGIFSMDQIRSSCLVVNDEQLAELTSIPLNQWADNLVEFPGLRPKKHLRSKDLGSARKIIDFPGS